MKRRIVQFVFVLSLLLVIATALLWLRSPNYSDDFGLSHQKYTSADHLLVRTIRFFTADGDLWLLIDDADMNLTLNSAEATLVHREAVVGWSAFFQPIRVPPPRSRSQYLPQPQDSFAGFGFHQGLHKLNTSISRYVQITVPLWFPLLLFSTPTLFNLRRRFKCRSRLRRSLCPTCGYDLRKSKDICPECGAAVSPA
ncbi:MAG TPA: hypothetical protein VGP94_11440 [Tepidisphaeraceae bacterium]|nr:hypothetical protein [Tepidisphaeraceae bacterium]